MCSSYQPDIMRRTGFTLIEMPVIVIGPAVAANSGHAATRYWPVVFLQN